MRHLFLTALLLFSVTAIWGQTKYTVKGKVTDETSGEWLVGISIGVKEIPSYGIFSNESGNYSLFARR